VVVDVHFPHQSPQQYDALHVASHNVQGEKVIIETLQILEDNIVRGIAMQSTDGLRRGDKVENTGNPISVPVGQEVLGHVFNALGELLDGQPIESLDKGIIPKAKELSPQRLPIHRPAPHFTKLSTDQQILETGIKVIDLLAPILKGGKV
jgi:F-type H+-transporting ATPase subunit beta